MQVIEALQKKIEKSELGQEWIHDSLMNQDVWTFEELGYTEEEARIISVRNIYFDGFSLPWLKLLAKLTAKASAREKCGLLRVRSRVNGLRQLNEFLVSKSYSQPGLITDSLLKEFIAQSNSNGRRAIIAYVVQLWAEEEWLKLPFVPSIYKKTTPKVETIPEEVLYQIYENFDLLPPPLERLFRLQIVLGCRIGELIIMPRQCLKHEHNKWFLLRWIQKQKHWRFYEIHPSVAELIREQQKFLKTQFGNNSSFDKLFCHLSTSQIHRAKTGGRFKVEPLYFPKVMTSGLITKWLVSFRNAANLKDKNGNKFKLTSHMFRRTKASIMAYCEAEDEYIAAVLGHASLDMLPHYRKRSLERLEKEADAKGYVDMYGRITSFKPRKRRYEKLAEIIENKVSTSLGGCHRPIMLGDCQYRYGCLNCDHHRVTEEDQPKIEADIKCLEKDLEQAKSVGQERRITEINRLLELLKNRLKGLTKLQSIQGKKYNGT